MTYALITAKALRTYEPPEYDDYDLGRSVRVRAIVVTAANSAEFGNGACIAPGARVDDGLLDLVVIAERSRLQTLLGLPRLFNGTVNRVPGCSIRRRDQGDDRKRSADDVSRGRRAGGGRDHRCA